MKKQFGKPQPDSDVVNKEPRVLLIGNGWVGQYMNGYFKTADIVTSEGYQKKEHNHYDLAIISVPTPMNTETGQCDTSIVENCVEKYAQDVNIFLIKSTVEIGTSKRLEETYNVPVCMSPEYVGETLGHPLLEPRRDAFQIIGGNQVAREAVARMFMRVLNANAPMLLVSHDEAEIIKYCENMWIMQRVSYWNDVFEICNALKASFTTVREGLVLDPRMSRTHSNVYPDNRGWAGKCLSKDMPALAYKMAKLGHPIKSLEFEIEKNAEVRKNYVENNPLMPKRPGWKK